MRFYSHSNQFYSAGTSFVPFAALIQYFSHYTRLWVYVNTPIFSPVDVPAGAQ